jgi:hypothetical protein
MISSSTDGFVRSVRSAREDDAAVRELTAASLYSGAGGLDMAFGWAGVRPIWANEADTDAAASYRKNVGDHLVEGDLTQLELPLDLHPDLVIGGPPCQGFSVAGKMDPSDPRNQHVHRFLDVVHLLQPQGFVMENVKALAVNPRWETLRGVKSSRCSSASRRRSGHGAGQAAAPRAGPRFWLDLLTAARRSESRR